MRIGQIGQAEIKMHPAMPVIVLALAYSSGGMYVASMLFTLALHEASHALCAWAVGMRITQIELMPFGGAVRLEGYQALSGWRGALIAAAGPLSNAFTVMACATLVQMGVCTVSGLRTLVMSNLVLMLLNMLPVLPMDGGRIVCALLSYALPEARCRRVLARIGGAVGSGFLLVGVYGAWKLRHVNLTLFMMGSYLLYAAVSEGRLPCYQQMESLMSKQTKLLREQMMVLRQWIAYGKTPVYRLAARLSAREMHRVCVVDESARIVGILEEEDLIRAMMKNPIQTLNEALERRNDKNAQETQTGVKNL